VMGTIQATEAIKLIIGKGELLLGRLLAYDALDMRFSEFRFERRRDCEVCGEHPHIGAPQDAVPASEALTGTTVQALSVRELQSRLANAADSLTVMDVREPYEFAAGHLKEAINVPLGAVKQWLGELSFDKSSRAEQLVFVCRSGARSAQACLLASELGIAAVNLQGGMLAWAKEVDREMVVV